jgi:hypothetical protein
MCVNAEPICFLGHIISLPRKFHFVGKGEFKKKTDFTRATLYYIHTQIKHVVDIIFLSLVILIMLLKSLWSHSTEHRKMIMNGE